MILGSHYFYRDLLKRLQVLGGAERVGDSGESTEVLCPARETNSRIAKKARVHSRGYDFARVFRTALATNRGRPPDHCFYPSSHLRCFPNFGGASSSRIGSRNLRRRRKTTLDMAFSAKLQPRRTKIRKFFAPNLFANLSRNEGIRAGCYLCIRWFLWHTGLSKTI